MAKAGKAAKKESSKVAGCMRKGSSIANVYEALEDGKKHSFSSLKSCLEKKSIDLGYRIRCLRKIGRQRKAWDIEITDDSARLIKGTSKAEPKAAPKPKAKPAAKKAAAKKTTVPRASVSDAPADDED